MTDFTIIAIGYALMFALIGLSAAFGAYRSPMRRLGKQERAFEEKIRANRTDEEQMARLRPLVDRVGLLKVGVGHGKAGVVFGFQVFVLDTLGAIHEVQTTHSATKALQTAQALAARLEAELEYDEAEFM